MGNTIKIHDKQFRKYISSPEIQKAIAGIAMKINKEYKGKNPLFLSVLNGSFMFSSDLLKMIKPECEVSFIKVSSYNGMKSFGKIKKLVGLQESVKGRHVVILEDIVDTGTTLSSVLVDLKKKAPKSLKVATLFFKPTAFLGSKEPDYVGLEIPNYFIVGYGLDFNGLGRNLKDIYILN